MQVVVLDLTRVVPSANALAAASLYKTWLQRMPTEGRPFGLLKGRFVAAGMTLVCFLDDFVSGFTKKRPFWKLCFISFGN